MPWVSLPAVQEDAGLTSSVYVEGRLDELLGPPLPIRTHSHSELGLGVWVCAVSWAVGAVVHHEVTPVVVDAARKAEPSILPRFAAPQHLLPVIDRCLEVSPHVLRGLDEEVVDEELFSGEGAEAPGSAAGVLLHRALHASVQVIALAQRIKTRIGASVQALQLSNQCSRSELLGLLRLPSRPQQAGGANVD
eukprot:CAMPEP_0115524288 /NCGR_PEP_ID=MMETSP0271-20121206/81097_1 /TAXON_ID=71861 /ORGANISM="Scrippsiella trochoidea, Strain CCMP3099" /LENGTH=191 /DNA_ID=CAMNT_0002955771 /DNA_START=1545 /DNA_END=2117 /DNA_ORIENTATION=-